MERGNYTPLSTRATLPAAAPLPRPGIVGSEQALATGAPIAATGANGTTSGLALGSDAIVIAGGPGGANQWANILAVEAGAGGVLNVSGELYDGNWTPVPGALLFVTASTATILGLLPVATTGTVGAVRLGYNAATGLAAGVVFEIEADAAGAFAFSLTTTGGVGDTITLSLRYRGLSAFENIVVT